MALKNHERSKLTQFQDRVCISHSLLLLHVSGTIVRIHAGILVWMRLYGIRIEDLQYLAKVDLLHQIIDVIVVIVMREYQQSLGNVTCLRQADNQMT